jgi:hypothetical protein
MPHRVALLAALVCAPIAFPEECEAESRGRFRRFQSAPVAVTSPLANDTLYAGESVVLSWKALPELALHSGIEEWEAFLSLDDGELYTVRLTPHLDLSHTSFSVTLPQFAARRARLLLRFGDEAEEFEYELPGEFEIHPARPLAARPAGWARGPGERARPDDPRDPGVAIWVEGDREGHGARTVVAAREGAELDAVDRRDWLVLRAATPSPDQPQVASAELFTHPISSFFVTGTAAPGTAPRAVGLEPRLSTCRQNE